MELVAIGTVESPLKDRAAAPKQGDEGGSEAWLVFEARFGQALDGIAVGDEPLLLTWLNRARRDVLRVHPRGNLANPEQGVFSTRSPDRPNPIGLHRGAVVAIDGIRLRILDLEALNGTPIIDVKPEGGRLTMNTPPIVSAQEWEAAREELLVREKELTRARDALAAERRRKPIMAVEKEYAFEGPHGRASLLDLFEGRRQLIVYRFFFEPGVAGWPERGCGGCSFLADQVAHLAHLNARDTTLAFVSRAPQPDIERWKARMGWEIPWYTVTDDFDADFGVDEWHGTNAFFRDGNRIFRTYFVNARGDEAMGSTWSYLDLTALGRQEEWEDSPEGYPQTPPYQWWNLHDEYGDAA